jgi:hypothetical protein
MAYYKNIYYATNSDTMNVATISAAEATSIESEIISIKANGLVNTIADPAARTALNTELGSPANAQTWRTDLGYQIPITATYGYEPGITPIPILSVVPQGSTSTFLIDGVSGVSFTNCTGFFINNIFGPEFENYKVFVNVDSTSAADTFAARYTVGGVYDSTTNHIRAGYQADSATPAVNGSSTGSAFTVFGAATARNFTAEIEFMKPASGYYPMCLTSSSYSDSSSLQGVLEIACQYNSATAPAFDGIYIYSSAGTATMSGTVRVYGYN